MSNVRAMMYRSYGGPENLELGEIPRPVPGDDQVLVRVRASSVNPIDWKRANGNLRLIMPACFPVVPGYDIAGEIAELGANAKGFELGQRVHARIGESAGGGSSDYAVAGIDVVTPIPNGMSMGDAAALPLAGMTALQGLRDEAELPVTGVSASTRVLVVGASGGVGHLAVQIARESGATVIGVCSGKNAALVLSLGAHEVIDYTTTAPFEGQAPFDVIFDCVAGDPAPWLPRLTTNGRYASCLPGAAVFLRSALNPMTDRKVRPVLLKSRAADLAFLDRLFETGKLKIVIDSRFGLGELPEAWRRSMSGRAVGKIVIDVA
jgi:NADPH:quinone reductase-like Zn-dependent oxidoreductase